MSFLRLIILISFFHSFMSFASTINCEPSTSSGGYNYDKWADIHTPFELKPSGLTMTLGANIPDWQLIYSVYTNIGVSSSSCNSGAYNMYFTLISQNQPVGRQGDDIIYSTNTPGIGISIEAAEENNAAVQSYPDTVKMYSASKGTGFWVNVKYWKIPGDIPMNIGPITIIGPDAATVYMSASNTFSSSETSRITVDNLAYINSSRILTLTILFQPGTCNIEGDNVNVRMGVYNGAGGHSDWKDASFKLVCPNGLGYHGSAETPWTSEDGYNYPYSIADDISITGNDKANGRVEISIVPYTEVLDANKGIIALDGTGATGYGIQLAWGDYSSQNSVEPTNPVILNSSIDANNLNSAFLVGDTPIGGNAFTGGDNTIKMAARYVRTTGETAPGPANAVVQVIANYQ